MDPVAGLIPKDLYGPISAQSICEGGGGGGYDDPCAALERDFTATEGKQRYAAGWRGRSARDLATVSRVGWGSRK